MTRLMGGLQAPALPGKDPENKSVPKKDRTA
jgi:hypothetical protein